MRVKIWLFSSVSTRKVSKKRKTLPDGGRAQCPSCSEALSEVEEIDDDIEATGYVQVLIYSYL